MGNVVMMIPVPSALQMPCPAAMSQGTPAPAAFLRQRTQMHALLDRRQNTVFWPAHTRASKRASECSSAGSREECGCDAGTLNHLDGVCEHVEHEET